MSGFIFSVAISCAFAIAIAEGVFDPAFEFVDIVEINLFWVEGDFFNFKFAGNLNNDCAVASFDFDDFVLELFLSFAKLIYHFHLVHSGTHSLFSLFFFCLFGRYNFLVYV